MDIGLSNGMKGKKKQHKISLPRDAVKEVSAMAGGHAKKQQQKQPKATAQPNKKHAGGRPSSYDAKRCPTVAWWMSVKGANDVEIAHALGIGKTTINKWKKDYPEFANSLKDGKEHANSQVARSMFDACFDHTIEEERTILKRNKETGQPEVISVERTKRVIPANTLAQQVWLYNRDGESWRRNPDAVKGESGRDPLLNYLDGLKDAKEEADEVANNDKPD